MWRVWPRINFDAQAQPIRHLRLSSNEAPPTEMVLTVEDHLVAYTESILTLEAVTLNGRALSTTVLPERITGLRAAPGGGFAMASGVESHEILVWQLNTMQLVERFVGCTGPLLDVLLLDKERTLCAFLQSGKVMCFRTREVDHDESDREAVMEKLAAAGFAL